MPPRLIPAIRLGSLLLLTVSLATSLATSLWAAEAADVERAAKRLRMQTYRLYRYDRREYDRRMEPLDRALATWREKGSPDAEAERLVEWIGAAERNLRAAPANSATGRAAGASPSSSSIAPSDSPSSSPNRRPRPPARIPAHIPPRGNDSPDRPQDTASSARSPLPRQRTSALAAPVQSARVAEPVAPAPSPPTLQIAPPPSSIDRGSPPGPSLDRASPAQRTRVPRAPRAAASPATSSRNVPLPPHRAAGNLGAGPLPVESIGSQDQGPSPRRATAPLPLAASTAGAFTDGQATSDARLVANAAATDLRSPQETGRSFVRRPKPSSPQRLPSLATATQDRGSRTERLPARRVDSYTPKPAPSLAATPLARPRQVRSKPVPFIAPPRVPTLAMQPVAFRDPSRDALTAHAIDLPAFRSAAASPTLHRLTPLGVPGTAPRIIAAASPLVDHLAKPVASTLFEPTMRAEPTTSGEPEVPANTAMVRSTRPLPDTAFWSLVANPVPLPASMDAMAADTDAPTPPMSQPAAWPVTRLATITSVSNSRADGILDDMPSTVSHATRPRLPFLLPRREMLSAAMPTNVPGSPRSTFSPLPRPASRPRTLLASTTVSVPRLPKPSTKPAPLVDADRGDVAETLNVPVLHARIRSYNLSRAALEDQVLANPEWNLDRMEAIVASCSQLLQQYRFLRLYHDAARQGQSASPPSISGEEPAPIDSLLKLVEDRCAARSSQLVVLDEVLEDEATREERQRLRELAGHIQAWSVERD